jgi:rod shape-determining protein MreC
VIGSSGSETSHIIYIDRGSNEGVEPNMAVITPEGIIGKVLRAYPSTSQVLEITDQTSGVGATLVKSRLQGILKGQPAGNPNLAYIMADESVAPGEDVITSGGDRIFPKGLPIGKVASVSPGRDLFLNVRVTPSANLSRLEEVLVITKITEKEADTKGLGPIRAADILAQRLPSVPDKPAGATPNSATGGAPQTPSSTGAGAPAASTPGAAAVPKPAVNAKPSAPVPGSASGKPVTAGTAASKPAASPTNGAAAKPKATQTQPAKPAVENTKPATSGEDTP